MAAAVLLMASRIVLTVIAVVCTTRAVMHKVVEVLLQILFSIYDTYNSCVGNMAAAVVMAGVLVFTVIAVYFTAGAVTHTIVEAVFVTLTVVQLREMQ